MKYELNKGEFLYNCQTNGGRMFSDTQNILVEPGGHIYMMVDEVLKKFKAMTWDLIEDGESGDFIVCVNCIQVPGDDIEKSILRDIKLTDLGL